MVCSIGATRLFAFEEHFEEVSMSSRYLLLIVLSLFLMPVAALADASAPGVVNSGDTAWMLTSTALVLIMTPGLAFFYAGMVRTKNVVSTLYQNFIALGVIGVLWAIIGYSLAFSTGIPLIGDLSFAMLNGVGQTPVDGNATIPHLVFMVFQMMFAIITPALMTGAFAERVRFKAWLMILILWSLIVYSPVAHWLWVPTGWLAAMGALDFAGGFVVHMTAGCSALVAAIMFGKRRDFGQPAKPYDVGMIVLGTALLWFGWFGFNAGSALTSGGLASQAFVNTFLAAAVAMLAWTAVDSVKDGKPTTMGGCIGVVAGLVAVTPAAGFVTTSTAMIIGLLAGVVCNLVARLVKTKFKLDDTLDVFACHGVGGAIGVTMTGLMATTSVNSAGADGLFNGGSKLFMANLTGVVAVAAYSMICTFVIIKVVKLITSLRVTDSEENAGLDSSQHGELISSH
jgi:ammonium transporter, Amt family